MPLARVIALVLAVVAAGGQPDAPRTATAPFLQDRREEESLHMSTTTLIIIILVILLLGGFGFRRFRR
jgi:hypothetical protein